MRSTLRVRPSKPASALAAVVGLGMIAVVISFFAIGPQVGVGLFFGLWIVAALGIVGYHVLNVVRHSGMSTGVIEVHQTGAPGPVPDNDFEDKLRKLERLRLDNLISQDEFDRKRAEILEQGW